MAAKPSGFLENPPLPKIPPKDDPPRPQGQDGQGRPLGPSCWQSLYSPDMQTRVPAASCQPTCSILLSFSIQPFRSAPCRVALTPAQGSARCLCKRTTDRIISLTEEDTEAQRVHVTASGSHSHSVAGEDACSCSLPSPAPGQGAPSYSPLPCEPHPGPHWSRRLLSLSIHPRCLQANVTPISEKQQITLLGSSSLRNSWAPTDSHVASLVSQMSHWVSPPSLCPGRLPPFSPSPYSSKNHDLQEATLTAPVVSVCVIQPQEGFPEPSPVPRGLVCSCLPCGQQLFRLGLLLRVP